MKPAVEKWKPVQGYSTYQISNYGRLRRERRHKPTYKGPKEYIYMRGATYVKTSGRQPYIMYHLTISDAGIRRYNVLAHRLVAFHFLENPNGLPMINHIDGNPSNNCVTNLEWCTAKENTAHAMRTGLFANNHSVGERNAAAKLREIDVINIRHCKGSISSIKLSEFYPVHHGTIRTLWLGRTWRCVT